MKKEWFKENKTTLYYALMLILIAIGVVAVFVMNYSIKARALDAAENSYHSLDKVYAKSFINSRVLNKTSDIYFADDENCYIAIIDAEGNVITHRSGNNVNVNATNIYQYLTAAKSIEIKLDEALARIGGTGCGRMEFYGGNQSKILLYTHVDGMSDYAVVRIIPKKYFVENKQFFGKLGNIVTIIMTVVLILLLCVVIAFYRYARVIEDNIARNNLIAEDNDLISFTYHSSIASFEVTGAVGKVFGEEIGKRSHIDWNTLSRLIHEDDQGLLRNISKAIKKGDSKYTTEFRLISPEGEYHWYRLNGKSIQGDDGEVNKFVGTIQNSDDQITHENMLKNKAEHDLLTGLLNKITMEESVNEVINNSLHSIYAFYIIDLDNFKAVNDNLGHAVGDKVLTDVASKLQLVFNEADYIGRLGGDEFAVLLVIPAMMTSQADKLILEKAAILNDMLRAQYGNDEITINVSASIGIAIFPEEGRDFQSLYQHADRALYYSKENGKDRHTLYRDVK